jgi:uncharacterized repeat protein (TIGR01451 family)
MLHRITWPHAALLIAGLTGNGISAAQSAERGCIELKTVAELEQTYVDQEGKTATRLVPVAKVVPGDEVVWTIVANNICPAPAAEVAITNAVPEHMHYLGETAFGLGADIEFSLDGSSFARPDALLVAEADGSTRTLSSRSALVPFRRTAADGTVAGR